VSDYSPFCSACGGHGATFAELPPDTPNLTPRQQRWRDRGRPILQSAPCTHCDGQDRVTPAMEAEAESRAEAGW
jgi:hypothetical protein